MIINYPANEQFCILSSRWRRGAEHLFGRSAIVVSFAFTTFSASLVAPSVRRNPKLTSWLWIGKVKCFPLRWICLLPNRSREASITDCKTLSYSITKYSFFWIRGHHPYVLCQAGSHMVMSFFFFRLPHRQSTRENNVHGHSGYLKLDNSIQHIFIRFLLLPGARDIIVKKTDMAPVLMVSRLMKKAIIIHGKKNHNNNQ